MNLEELLKAVGLKQEKLLPAETTTLVTLLEYDPEAAEKIAEKIKAQIRKREQIEALRERMKESFLGWLADANKNGICVIASLHYTAPDQINIRFSTDGPINARRQSTRSGAEKKAEEELRKMGLMLERVEDAPTKHKPYRIKLKDGRVVTAHKKVELLMKVRQLN